MVWHYSDTRTLICNKYVLLTHTLSAKTPHTQDHVEHHDRVEDGAKLGNSELVDFPSSDEYNVPKFLYFSA